MKKSSLIRLASLIGITLTGLAAHAQVINYHNAYNYAYGFNGGPDPGAPLYGSLVYVGQGAYSDPGHNVWNGFGGGFNPTSNGYSPGDAGHTTGTYPQYYSDGSAAPITLTVNYGFDNGGFSKIRKHILKIFGMTRKLSAAINTSCLRSYAGSSANLLALILISRQSINWLKARVNGRRW